MLTRRTIAKLMLAGAAAWSVAARGRGKVVVYTANDSKPQPLCVRGLHQGNRIDVEPVEAGSGVVFRRINSEKERPLATSSGA